MIKNTATDMTEKRIEPVMASTNPKKKVPKTMPNFSLTSKKEK